MPEEYARPIHRSNQVCHILEYVIVGASLYVTEASCLQMSGSALRPGVLLVNKRRIQKQKSFSALGLSWFVKTTVFKALKRNFQLQNFQSNLFHIMSIFVLLRFEYISTRTLTSPLRGR